MREQFIHRTVEWLNRRVAPEGVTVDADTRLFDGGVVDSLGVLRLIAWTERAIGRRIDDREVRMDRFASVRAMAEHFVTARAAGAEHDCVSERAASAERRCASERACARCGLRRRAA
ncbi:MAG TPA: acyl carrier protein [Longimicrobiales bacterium]